MAYWRLLALLLCTVVGPSLTYKVYEDKIPNGESVPHPCKPNYIWKGVGHQNVLGGGARNPFGADFAAAEHTWTQSLCLMDSDQDGSTNGAELGDPDCTWSEGGVPTQSLGLSHPGICEPTDSADCLAKNSWAIDCSFEDFYCEGVQEADTLNVTLMFDNTAVPAKETSYMCQTFSLPSDRVYHLFATKPEIDNAYVMHHTVVYGCAQTPSSSYENAKECAMYSEDCTKVIGLWSVGWNGECQRQSDGFLVGNGHFTTVMVQHHWNNPTFETSYYDASGITLFLTPNLRQNNLAIFTTGQEALEIPPQKSAYTVRGTCPAGCLAEKLSNTVYITAASIHMHYLGSAGRVEQWRDNQLINSWVNESEYSYDLPVVSLFDPPLELRKGDEIKTYCTYKSTSKSTTTYFGEATSDEMCYAFMNYYPSENGPDDCVSYEEYDSCELEEFYENTAAKFGSSFGLLFFLAALNI